MTVIAEDPRAEAKAQGGYPAGDPVIRLERVSKQYGHTTVIHALDLDVARGEFLTLLGPSGCGKTTTLRMIAGFETPTSGHIYLDGRDVSAVPPYGRHLNTVFQQYALFPHMTVFDNVAFGPRTQKLDRALVTRRVEEALAMVNMAAHARKRPAELSGGQQQRVALARALVNYPSALLLDEPLSALDVKLRRSMQLELKRIQTEVNTTFVFVTHDQDEALTMSTRIAVMNEGRIEQLDAPQEIYARPRTPFVAGFIGHANLLPGRVTDAADGTARVALDGGGGGPAAAPAGVRAGDRVFLMLRPEQAMLLPPDRRERNEAGFAVRLRARDFQGASVRYALARDDGAEIVVNVLPQHQPAAAEIGDPLWVAWNADQAWVVPERT